MKTGHSVFDLTEKEALLLAANDIGIDLGTASVLIYDPERGLMLKEPSVVAANPQTGEVIAVGETAQQMLGRTPDKIRAVMPLSDGVISDFDMTSAMITQFIKKVTGGGIIKPRVIICVPSGITEVESNAVAGAATAAGARKVFLIEEPVAAALGAGIDISKPEGHIILDIGGGTSDIAVLSLNGIVCKTSVKMAGRKIDDAIVKYVRTKFGILIGERMAERAKIAGASVMFDEDENIEVEIKGRDLRSGLPKRQNITRAELSEAILESVMVIVDAVGHMLEITPPELAADIHENGLLMTGGGSQLHGLDRLLCARTGLNVVVADHPTECVAIGTARAFQFLDQLYDGFVNTPTKLR